MSEKQTSLLRFLEIGQHHLKESDVDDEGPTTSKNVKGHMAGIVESIIPRWENLIAAKQAHDFY